MSFHFIPYAEEEGMAKSTAALAFGLMSGLNVVGLLGATFLADKFPRKNLLALVYGARFIGYMMLFILPAPCPSGPLPRCWASLGGPRAR